MISLYHLNWVLSWTNSKIVHMQNMTSEPSYQGFRVNHVTNFSVKINTNVDGGRRIITILSN
jgi:hypothetical protein